MSQFPNVWSVCRDPEEPSERVWADAATVVDGALVFAQASPPRVLRAYAPGQWRSVMLAEIVNGALIWDDQ